MKRQILVLIFYFVFWLLFFQLSRFLFLIYNYAAINNINCQEIIPAFWHCLLLDISTVCYIFILPILLICITSFFGRTEIFRKTLIIFTAIIIPILSLIIVANAETYTHWGYLLSASSLTYLSTPEAIYGSISLTKMILLISIWFIFSGLSFLIFYFCFRKIINTFNRGKFYSLLYLLVLIPLFIGIRGGVGTVPINVSSAYYSKHSFCNHIAVNEIWNLGQSFFSEDINYSNYQFFSDENELFEQLDFSEDTTYDFKFRKEPENIIFIVLESFTADAIACLGGENLAPNIDKWSTEGILFNNFYANSDRSNRGLVSIFSSIPALSDFPLMKDAEKTKKLPSLIRKLCENDYKSAYYYGGDAGFSNMKSYMLNIGFQKIFSQNNLNLNCASNSKWGYHDECMFDVLYNDIENSDGKNVFTLFTLSSHEPYEVPFKNVYPSDNEWNKARNSYLYTDSCVNVFLTKLKKSPKWENSLVILVSDHGTLFPGNKESWQASKYKILMLWLGGTVENQAFVYTNLADQLDISATLLPLLNIPANDFIFSDNLFKKKNTNTYYYFFNGFGFIKNNQFYAFSFVTKENILSSEDNGITTDFAKAYTQKISNFYKTLE